jgi:S1-C subfamily serine protease
VSVIWRSEALSRREIGRPNFPVIDGHEELASFLTNRFGADAAALFAVPTRQRDGSIVWADRKGAEQTRALRELTGGDRDKADIALRQALQKVETACDASPAGQSLLAALNIESPDAIRITADGRPIIAGWGAVPAALTTPAQLASHHQATLGPYLSRVETPQFWVSSVTTIIPHGWWYGSRGLLAAVVIAALVLAWLLLPGVLRNTTAAAPPIDFSGSNRSIERQIETLRHSLESNVCIATALPRLELQPDGGVPRTDSGTAVRPTRPGSGPSPAPTDGLAPSSPSTGANGSGAPGTSSPATPEGAPSPSPSSGQPPQSGDTATPRTSISPSPSPSTSPSSSPSASPSASPDGDRRGQGPSTDPGHDAAQATPTPPVDPNTSQVPPQVNPGQGNASVLATLLKKSTVIIVTKSGTGSGFFVSRDHILTNRHVVEDADNKYWVGNKALAQLLPAELVGTSASSRIGSPDFALLKLKSGSSDTFLSFSETLPAELENVIATGYPGFVISGDESYRRMMGGDVRSVPETALTSGAVTFIQNPTGPSPVILHYAAISPGNSGGPLTDECGRVVGVNTFVRGTDGANARMNYSLAASSAISFLRSNNISPNIAAGVCTRAAPGATAQAQPPSVPSPTAPQASQDSPAPGAGKSAKSPPASAPAKKSP